MAAKEIIAQHFGVQTDNGPCGRVARFVLIIPELLKAVEGNIVELGCGEGQSSCIFLGAAERYGRKFLAVDPWYSTCLYKFANFSANVNIMSEHIEICRCESNSSTAIAAIQRNAPIAFGFVDSDMYSTECVLTDMRTFAGCNAAVICVDDQKFDKVIEAIELFMAENNNYERISEKLMHETYLVRKA